MDTSFVLYCALDYCLYFFCNAWVRFHAIRTFIHFSEPCYYLPVLIPNLAPLVLLSFSNEHFVFWAFSVPIFDWLLFIKLSTIKINHLGNSSIQIISWLSPYSQNIQDSYMDTVRPRGTSERAGGWRVSPLLPKGLRWEWLLLTPQLPTIYSFKLIYLFTSCIIDLCRIFSKILS